MDVLNIATGVGQELPAWQNVLDVLAGGADSWTATLGVEVVEGCGEEEPDGLHLVAAPAVTAMPNPASDRIQWTGWEGEPVRVVLRNALGQTLATFPQVWPGQTIEVRPSWRGVVLRKSLETAGRHGPSWSFSEPALRKACPTFAEREQRRSRILEDLKLHAF